MSKITVDFITPDHIDTRSEVGTTSNKKELISHFTACYVKSEEFGKTYMLEIQPGFKFDGASIPRAAWPIIGHPWANFLPAALAHDAAYCTRVMGREDADNMFRSILESLEVPAWKVKAMYTAVRTFGGFPWAKYDKETIEYNRQFVFLREVGL